MPGAWHKYTREVVKVTTARVCETCAYWDTNKLATNIGSCRFHRRETHATSTCTSYRPKVNYVGKKEAK